MAMLWSKVVQYTRPSPNYYHYFCHKMVLRMSLDLSHAPLFSNVRSLRK